MKKILKSFMLATVVSALVLSSQAIAASPDKVSAVEELQQKTNQILEQSGGISKEDRLKELEKLGWEIQPLNNESTVSPLSYPGDGKITNYFLKDSKTGTYLVQALWDFTGKDWDSTSNAAYDIIGIAVTDQNGKSVNAQGTNGGIVMQDKDYNRYSNGASLYSYQDSGATYTFFDHDKNGQGTHGFAWFYIAKPTSGTSYYMKSQWIHTWNNSTATLTSLTLKYPFEISASFTKTPLQWGTSDQDRIVFD
ncbi:hypothetical protein ACFQ3W_25885 [Paenibacillus puldeungensis]|uniref:Uncharacterized protein n=1 Tax=Paenibacillus puldeungensis TaxID=696536 RepID=A0ABW3S688_9BACL